jgi:hypothetical protein
MPLLEISDGKQNYFNLGLIPNVHIMIIKAFTRKMTLAAGSGDFF